jgi:hypothetical protein
MPQLKLGCDPELFISKGGQVVSAHNLLPGTKKAPYAVHRGAIQVDGTAAEFNIDPAENKEDWLVSIQELLQQLEAQIPDFELRIMSSVEYSPEYLASLPEVATTLGCDPDFNAYTLAANEKPNEKSCLRTAGGHIHLGWCESMDINDPGFNRACAAMARQMDFYLGMPSVLWDKDTQRRTMYGQAGAYRPKPYGVEYRSLSNKWLEDQWLRAWAFDNAQAGFRALAEEGQDLFATFGSVAQDCINSNDEAAALEWCNKLGINTGLRQ